MTPDSVLADLDAFYKVAPHRAYAELSADHLRPLVAAVLKDDKLAVHRRRCMAGGGPCPGECKRALDLYADAEASRAVALDALQTDIAKAQA